MHKVESYDQIKDFISAVRSLRQGFVTNFYWDSNKHTYWLAEGTLLYEMGAECILLIHRNKDFANLYYIATGYSAVTSMLEGWPSDQDLVVDIVCKGDGKAEQEAFQGIGFKLYRRLYRMNHVGLMVQSEWERDGRVENGTKDDAKLVFEALQRDFDPLCEQLPSQKELEDFAERHQMLVIKDGDNLCGFLIAEQTGVTWYLRYWYTSPYYRDSGIGARLLRASLIDAAGSKRQLFWVIDDNENAIKRYEHYGFERENMNDFVMIKRYRS